jgi:hypothetical protein
VLDLDADGERDRHRSRPAAIPSAVAITNDGDGDDSTSTSSSPRIFGELIDSATRPDGYDDAKQGVVDTFDRRSCGRRQRGRQPAHACSRDSGFTADRRQFCLNTRLIMQADPMNPTLFFNAGPTGGRRRLSARERHLLPGHGLKRCVRRRPIGKGAAGRLSEHAARRDRAWCELVLCPTSARSPRPRSSFDTLVQSMIGVLDRVDGVEMSGRTVNLSGADQRRAAARAADSTMQKVFANDVVAIDANKAGTRFLVVSRGANYVMRVELDDEEQLEIGAPSAVVRFQTANIPDRRRDVARCGCARTRTTTSTCR